MLKQELPVDVVEVVETEIVVEVAPVLEPPVVSIEVPGIQGAKGDKGDKGDKGETPVIIPISTSFIDNLF